MGKPVVHWEIGGHDLDRLATFYQTLFGWNARGFDAAYRLLDTDGGIGGGLMRCPEGVPPYVTLYVAVDDIEATLAKVEELGGSRMVPPTSIEGVGWFALFRDPEGNAIGLLHAAAPSDEKEVVGTPVEHAPSPQT